MKLKHVLTVCFMFFIFLLLSCNFVFAGGGDGVFRDMQRKNYEYLGHAGMDIGNNQIIHMQGGGCCSESFSSSFSSKFWGYITQGDSKAATKRVDTAKAILKDKKPKYSFIFYKSYPKSFRCDGFDEYCFEQAPGGNIVVDWGFFTLSPLKQWTSSRIQWKDQTTRGVARAYLDIKAADSQMVDEYINTL